MSVLLFLSFAFAGVLAMVAIAASWRQFAPRALELRNELAAPPVVDEVRLTVEEHVVVRIRPNRGLLRHLHRPKPVKHRLHGRSPRRAAA